MRGIAIQADKTRMLRFSINAMIEYKQARQIKRNEAQIERK